MNPNKRAVLECKNLSKEIKKPFSQKKIKIIDKISLSIPEGSLSIILGHNGAGKSTLIKSIMGFKMPDDGEIYFNGKPLQTKDRAHIGYMPESEALPMKLTPLESLNFHARVHGYLSGSSTTMELLEKVGLKRHQNKLNRDLSKGMGRRLAWALATLHSPTLLILDEPYSGLDPIGRVDMTSWIKELNHKGTTILVCTHELDRIPDYTDEIYILNQGKLVFQCSQPIPETDALLQHLKPVSEGH